MNPAFSSIRQAAGFAFLLLFILLLPLLTGKSWLPPREQIYSSLPWGDGAFPYLHDQIFLEKGDIDIAFMGTSRIWWAIDTPRVQAQLSEQLGRPAIVRTLGWNTPGYDPLYFILQDLLAHRKVRVLVIADCTVAEGGNAAHPRAPLYFRLGENAEALAGLPLKSQFSFYTSAIIGMPHTLLCLLRTNLPPVPSADISWPGFEHLENPSRRLGSLAVPKTFGRIFSTYTAHTAATPADVRVYSEATKQDFYFSDDPPQAMQIAFAGKIGKLARDYHVQLVFLHLPRTNEFNSTVIVERTFWPNLFGLDLTMMGIPPQKLFGELNEEACLKLFYNDDHLNQNGQEYFTPIITPRLVQFYEAQTKP